MKRLFVFVALVLVTTACGSTPTPTEIPTTTTIPATTTIPVPVVVARADLVGTVRDAVTLAGLGGATVRISSGPDSGKTATAAADGYYVLANVQVGTFFVQVSATGRVAVAQSVTLTTGNTTIDFALVRTPPAVEYRLTGTARRCSATYENSTGGTNQSRVDIPFSYSWDGARSGDFLYMSCQIDTAGDQGTLTVAIYKNGVFYRSGMAIGFPNIATASGSY